MMILKYWRFILGAATMVAFVGAYGYAHHKGYAEGVAATAVKVKAADAQAQARVSSLKSKLATQAAASVSRINALRAQIANQPTNQKVVYVEVPHTTPGPVEYVPIATPVFVTWGAVRLYNASLPGLLPSTAPSANTRAAALPSAVSVDDYESTALFNNAACTENTEQLVELINWVKGVTHR